MPPPLDPLLERFLRERLETLEQIEVLLILREQRDRDFAPGEVADARQLGGEAAVAALRHLAERGLLASDGGPPPRYRYRPRDAELDRGAEALAAAWRDRRTAVIEWVCNEAIERMRSSALRTFAESFWLRRRRRDG
jgi:hypothetical protein